MKRKHYRPRYTNKKRGRFVPALLLVVALLAGAGAFALFGPGLPFLQAPAPVVSSGPASSKPEASQSQPPASQPASSAVTVEGEGIFKDSYGKAAQTMAQMSLKEKVGQVFLFRAPIQGELQVIEEYQPGGFFLMSQSFEGKTAEQVRAMTQSYQQAGKVKMALAVDEEGGTVVRVSQNSALAQQKFRSPQVVYANGGIEGIRQDALKKADLLLSYGLNVNLAPVADVTYDRSAYMFSRAFAKNWDKNS